MKLNLILATVLTTVGNSSAGLAMAAGTGTEGTTVMSEAQMFQAAKVTLDQASQIALKEVPGTLAAIGFNDENGKGVYEAMIVGADGQPSIVKIEADSGAVVGKGLASYFDDESDGNHEGDAGHDNGEHEDGENKTDRG